MKRTGFCVFAALAAGAAPAVAADPFASDWAQASKA